VVAFIVRQIIYFLYKINNRAHYEANYITLSKTVIETCVSNNNLNQFSIFAFMKHSLLALPSTFNETTWSLCPSHPAWHFNYICILFHFLIIFVNSCNVCVLYFHIFINKLYLLETNCSHLFPNRLIFSIYEGKF
jgi:hypothetical protein